MLRRFLSLPLPGSVPDSQALNDDGPGGVGFPLPALHGIQQLYDTQRGVGLVLVAGPALQLEVLHRQGLVLKKKGA